MTLGQSFGPAPEPSQLRYLANVNFMAETTSAMILLYRLSMDRTLLGQETDLAARRAPA